MDRDTYHADCPDCGEVVTIDVVEGVSEQEEWGLWSAFCAGCGNTWRKLEMVDGVYPPQFVAGDGTPFSVWPE